MVCVRCPVCRLFFASSAAALETYIRRVYRAFEIMDISVKAETPGMTVDWAFRFRDVSPELTPVSCLGPRGRRKANGSSSNWSIMCLFPEFLIVEMYLCLFSIANLGHINEKNSCRVSACLSYSNRSLITVGARVLRCKLSDRYFEANHS